jgi:hypothetical protein
MRATTARSAGPSIPRSRRLAAIMACSVVGLALGVGVRADTPEGRRPGEPLVERLTTSNADRVRTTGRVATIAESLGIHGHATTPRRTYEALDLRVVDETELIDRRGRTVAVVRTDGSTGALRSIVRLDWSADATRPRVDRSTAETHARRQARLAGLTAPTAAPEVRWDDAMGAWRATWTRRIDGHRALGDGLTVWIYRGGQLAALTRSETTAAKAPLEPVGPEAAMTAARDWATRTGLPQRGLTMVVAPDLVWVRPNDFLLRGGADDTDPRLHLAYRIDLATPISGSTAHHVVIFVDAGNGALIAGAETA